MIGQLSLVQRRLAIGLIAFFTTGSVMAQTALTLENFDEEILNYNPIKTSGNSEKDFNFASMVIRETKLAVNDDVEGFNLADYFNVLTAFLSLKESDENIQLAFEKFSNSEGACEYFTSDKFIKSVNEDEVYARVRTQFNARTAECEKGAKPKPKFDLASYCRDNGLNQDLVALIQEIDRQDRKYREGDYDNHKNDQKILDIENQFTIDSLYEVHGRYIGESLVGSKFESTMWAVIQHSNTDMMKKYLPVLKQAVQGEELAEATLKMTIDRYYALTDGFQVFGSQAGFGASIANDEVRARIAKEYGVKQ
jgi:hypothetical protein